MKTKQLVLCFTVLGGLCAGLVSCGNENEEEETSVTLSNSGSIGDHSYVDLGLSVKWATCNVGASSPEEYGNSYAWGETTPKSSYTKDNSKTNGVHIGDISGNADYDAATANWGAPWRMPTLTEINELRQSCTWEWTTYKGVEGMKVTGPNGNCIFLPPSGWRNGTDRITGDGYYWSSTPYESNDSIAYSLFFHSLDYGWIYDYRSSGYSVRPVSE